MALLKARAAALAVVTVGILSGVCAGPAAGSASGEIQRSGPTRAPSVHLVSHDLDGEEGELWSHYPEVSGNGRYVTFGSDAQLVPDDNQGWSDVYLFDRKTDRNVLISRIGGDGSPGGGAAASVSADGDQVAFVATLDPTDYNADSVYLVDRTAAPPVLEFLTPDPAGFPEGVGGMSIGPHVSGDGRYVTFISDESSLVPDDTNELRDVFVYDRWTGTTAMISRTAAGGPANGDSGQNAPSISASGRFIAYASAASNLVEDDKNELLDIFVYDQATGRNVMISRDGRGRPVPLISDNPEISADGKYVVFERYGPPQEAFVGLDVYVCRLSDLKTELASPTEGGETAAADEPSISGNGRYVAYIGGSDAIVPGDANEETDVFVYDRQRHRTTLITRNAAGEQTNGRSAFPPISDNGKYVAFMSYASNLFPNDTNNDYDVFLYGR